MRAHRLALLASSIVAVSVAASGTAHAGGLEYNGAGTEAAGRGGAWSARADTPMALQLNPALLSDLPGVQVMLDVNVGLFDSCFARAGHYNDNLGAGDPTTARFAPGWETSAYPTVCNATPFSPGASLAVTVQITPAMTLGFGILSPYAAGATRFGSDDAYADPTQACLMACMPGDTACRTACGHALPSPARYVLSSQNLLQIFPSVGIGYRFTPWFSVGAVFQWGIASIDDRIVSASLAGEDPAGDVFTKLNVSQFFEPAGILSVAFRPVYEGQHRLDIMGSFRYVSPIEANGSLTLSGNEFASPSLGLTPASTTVNNVHLHAPQPYTAQLGIRYGLRRGSELETQLMHGRRHDALATEVFDVEVDAVYEGNSLVNDFVVTLPADVTMRQFMDPFLGVNATVPTPVILPHHWRDQVSLRVGGDWNVIRDMLAVRAGFSWESQGMSTPYAQLDFINATRYQLHLGLTFRIDDVDLSAAYIHIWQDKIDSTMDGAFQQNSASGPGAVVNKGVITADWNIFSLGATAHFR